MPAVAAGSTIGTKALLGAIFGTAAASTATSLYATKRAGSLNEKSIRAQQEEARQNAQLERERREADERLYLASLARDRERWGEYTRIMWPHWQVGASALSGLYNMAGLSGGAPTGTAPTGGAVAPPTGTAGPLRATASTGTGPAYLDALPNTYGRTAAARRLRQARPGLTPAGVPMSSLSQLMALASLFDARGPQARGGDWR